MATHDVSEVANNLDKYIDLVQKEEVKIVQDGKLASVMISPKFFERLVDAWEDLQNLNDIQNLEIDKEPRIPKQ